jgi:DNA primase
VYNSSSDIEEEFMSETATKISFAELKKRVSMEQVIGFLDIKALKQKNAGQWKGPCPFCKTPDSFVINNDGGRDKTGAFNCFKCPAGGDQIELVSMMRGNKHKDAAGAYAAAKELAEKFPVGGKDQPTKEETHPQSTGVAASKRSLSFDPEAYAKTLDAAHEGLSELGVSPETLRGWRAGYASTGVNKGRLALAVLTAEGTIAGFIGRAIKDDFPTLTFPNNLNPQAYIYGADRVEAGPLILVHDPIDVLRAAEAAYGNVVCFLSQEITPQQLQNLSTLMIERKCESLTFY